MMICFEWALAVSLTMGLTLEVDTEWGPHTAPRTVTEDLTIAPGVELTLLPDTILHMGQGTKIVVEGSLRAVGQPGKPIVFTGEGWKHLSFRGENSRSSVLAYCRVEGAEVGILCERASPRIIDCTIQRNGLSGVVIRDGRPELIHNAILENGWSDRGTGVLVEGTTSAFPQIRFNKIAHNYGSGLEVRGQATLSLEFNTIAANIAAGILVKGGARLITVNRNNFIGNQGYHLVNETQWSIDARDNYWGWGETQQIRTLPEGQLPTFLHLQTPEGKIIYTPWQSEGIDRERAYEDWKRANPLPEPQAQADVPTDSSLQASGRGYVLHIFADGKRAIIDYNKHDAIKKGMRFRIQREGLTIGMLKVEEAHDSWSDAMITASTDAILPGDRISLDPVIVQSDTTWISSRWFSEDWLSHRLDPGHRRYWEPVQLLDAGQVALTEGLKTFLTQHAVPLIWAPSIGQRGKLYFRKTFDLEASPTEAHLRWAAAVPSELYINESWVVQLVDTKQPQELNVLPYVHRGRNIIAIVCDRGSLPNAPYGFAFSLTVQQQPSGGD